MGQDHDGGHAQPSSPPSSSSTHLETSLFLSHCRVGCYPREEPHQENFITSPCTPSWLGEPKAPVPSPFTPYFTLGINTTPLLHPLYPFNRTTLPTPSVTQDLWHQKTKKNSAKLKLFYVALPGVMMPHYAPQVPSVPKTTLPRILSITSGETRSCQVG